MTCQLPDEESLGDWTSVLRGHADELPEDADKKLAGTGKQRDVHALGRLAFRILTGTLPPPEAGAAAAMLPSVIPDLPVWFAKATARDAPSRHADAREMADGFAALVERSETYAVDQTLIDRHETSDVPYFLWPMVRQLPGGTFYVGRDAENNEVTVKTWPSIRRGGSAATDIAMTRLFDGVGRLVTSPVPGLPGTFALACRRRGRSWSTASQQAFRCMMPRPGTPKRRCGCRTAWSSASTRFTQWGTPTAILRRRILSSARRDRIYGCWTCST